MKQTPTTEAKKDQGQKKARPAPEAAPEGLEQLSATDLALGIGAPGTQADLLGDPDLPAEQRRAMAKRISQVQGNQHLQTLAVMLKPASAVIQRQGGGGAGGGGGPAVLGQADVQYKLALQMLSDVYGGAIKSGGKVVELSQAEFFSRYDQEKINAGATHPFAKDPTDQYWEANAPWKEGDAQKTGERIYGFYSNGEILIPVTGGVEDEEDNRIATIAHEILHANCSADFNGSMPDMFVEGATEALTQQAISQWGGNVQPGAPKYKGIMADFNAFMGLVGGLGVIQAAYFGGANIAISAFDAQVGPGAFQALKQCLAQGNGEDFTGLLTQKLRPQWMKNQNTAIRIALKKPVWISESDIDTVRGLWSQMLPAEKDTSRAETLDLIARVVSRDAPKNALNSIVNS